MAKRAFCEKFECVDNDGGACRQAIYAERQGYIFYCPHLRRLDIWS